MDYSRGWKNQTSRSVYFRKIIRLRSATLHQTRPNRSGRGFGWLRGIGRFFRWLFHFNGWWKKLLALAVFLGLLAFIVFGILFLYYSYNLPDPNRLLSLRSVPESTKIYDRNSKLLYEIHGEVRRTLVTLDQIPPYAKEASIAVEDKDFYKHGGIDFLGIVRSLLVDVLTARLSQGGSTITQQFVRNAVLSREKTVTRKIKEIVLSLELERKYTKDQILQLYLNEIPYGSNAYGIEAASQTFFGKSAKDLTLPEAAYLAAMPQAPTYYSPFGPHRSELDARARTVLELMYQQGYISKDQKDQAQKQKVEFRPIANGILAPHFVLYVEDLLAQKYGEISLQEGGLKVTTTLDLDLQTIAEDAVTKQAAINEKTWDGHNAALVALDPQTGEILAMVGSKNYFGDLEPAGCTPGKNCMFEPNVNVTLAARQPGSSFKPYVYATAFKKGMNPATMLLDVITNFGQYGGKDYIPTDYDGKERGPVSIRQALQNSLNIPAVKTMILSGVPDAIDTAEAMGITTLQDRSRYGPSLVLGGGEVELLEHAAAYGVFATNGIKHDTIAILKVEDKDGKVLEEYQPSEGREVLNPQVAYQIANVLSDKQARSLLFTNINNKLTLGDRPVGAKTGTTQEFRDAWTVGFTPGLVAGVWVGNNNNASMKKGADGLIVAAPIWNDFMGRALAGKPVENFTAPPGITPMAVDSLSGLLPTPSTPSTKTDIFTSFNAPTQYDDLHILGQTFLHSEKPDDPAWENPVQAWALAHGYSWRPVSATGGTDYQQTDQTLSISVSVPDKITSLPWNININATGTSNPADVQLFLDNTFIAESSSTPWTYQGNAVHADGAHQLMVLLKTANNKISQRFATLNFALGQNLSLLFPKDDQQLTFPTNVVLESNINLAPENVKFAVRSAAGKTLALGGHISKQQLGQIYQYTLNWAIADKPAAGSYSIYGQIGKEISNQVTVKIP